MLCLTVVMILSLLNIPFSFDIMLRDESELLESWNGKSNPSSLCQSKEDKDLLTCDDIVLKILSIPQTRDKPTHSLFFQQSDATTMPASCLRDAHSGEGKINWMYNYQKIIWFFINSGNYIIIFIITCCVYKSIEKRKFILLNLQVFHLHFHYQAFDNTKKKPSKIANTRRHNNGIE